jgi:NAD(P)H dehydrogenase (quinone)
MQLSRMKPLQEKSGIVRFTRWAEMSFFLRTVISGIYTGIRNGSSNMKSDFKKDASRDHISWDDYFYQVKEKN